MTPRPTASGSLAKTPFAHLLLYLHARKLSGTLAIWTGDGADKKGQDRVLLEEGMVTAMRPVEPAKSLYAALMPLFAREDAPYGFYAGQNLLGQSGTLREPIDLHTLLSRGVRVHVNEQLVDSVLERVRGWPLRLRSGVSLERLELNQRELTLIEPLREGGATLDTLIASGALPPREAKRTLYLLTLVKAVETSEERGSMPGMDVESFAPPRVEAVQPADARRLGDTVSPPRSGAPARTSTARPSFGSTAPSLPPPRVTAAPPANHNAGPSVPPAPAGLNPADEQRWSELVSLYLRLDELNHYQLLGVAQSASASDAQGAYFALVKKFHPDRLPLSLQPLSRAAQQLFDRMTEANETLGNPQQRADYDAQVAGGGGTRAAERTMRNVLEAALEFQKAEVHLRRRELMQAQALVQSAIAKNPEDADSHALSAWIVHLLNPGPDAQLEEPMRSLDRALKVNPRHERAHYYRGVLLKRLKREQEAIRHFRTAAELNPHNVDAAREVRLASLRRDSKPPPAHGVLSRLFNKK